MIKRLRHIILTMAILLHSHAYAGFEDGLLGDFMGVCWDPPQLAHLSASTKDLDLQQTDWTNTDIFAKEGKTIYINWSYNRQEFSRYRILYKMVDDIYEAMYVAKEQVGGGYKWISAPVGRVYHALPTDSGDIVTMRLIPKATFFHNLDMENYNVSLDSNLDNKFLFANQNSSYPSSSVYNSLPTCQSGHPVVPCIYKNGEAIDVHAPARKGMHIPFFEYNNSRMMYFVSDGGGFKMDYMHNSQNVKSLGQYYLEVEVGKPSNVVGADQIALQYMICPTGDNPNTGSCNTSIVETTNLNYKDDSYASGDIWIRPDLNNPDGRSYEGTLKAKVQSYQGSNAVSKFIYGSIVEPVQSRLRDNSRIMYENFVGNAKVKRTFHITMTLYILIFGLYFVAGAVKLTTSDLLVRVGKIAVIVQLFEESSWEFFNTRFFQMFTEGMDYLIKSITGLTGEAGNIFGFIDPIVDMIWNVDYWAALVAQLFYIFDGSTVFAIANLIGIASFMMGALDIVIGYLMAFLGLSIMVAMAPLFILFMLFEPTRSLFDNWLSVLFRYTIEPTVILLLFLVVEQMMMVYIGSSVTKSCIGIWLSLWITIPFTIPLLGELSFPLPFFPFIPFIVPENIHGNMMKVATSSFMVLTYGLLGLGLTNYAISITSQLSHVMPSNRAGKGRASQSMIADIKSDMKGAVMGSPVQRDNKGGNASWAQAGGSKKRDLNTSVDRKNKSEASATKPIKPGGNSKP